MCMCVCVCVLFLVPAVICCAISAEKLTKRELKRTSSVVDDLDVGHKGGGQRWWW